MGNGPGLKGYGDSDSAIIDTEGGVLTEEMIEKAVQSALRNFGTNPPLIMSPAGFSSLGWEAWPEYNPTPWAQNFRMSKREHKMAKLQTLLGKLRIIKDEETHKEIYETAQKRLKRAKWARYQKSKNV